MNPSKRWSGARRCCRYLLLVSVALTPGLRAAEQTAAADVQPGSDPGAPATTAQDKATKGQGVDRTGASGAAAGRSAPPAKGSSPAKSAATKAVASPEIFFPSEQVPSDRPIALPADI